MLAKYKKKFKEDLVKVLSMTALANLVKIGINLITTKVVAVLIGPNGVALVGQFTNFISTLTTISTGGISNGTIRYISEYKEDKSVFDKYISASFSITLFFSLLSTAALLLFAKQVSMLLFDDLKYISIIYITALTLFLSSINSFFLSIINGKKLYDKFILINLLSSISGFVFTLVLVFFFRVYGALLALATYQSVIIFITIHIATKNKLFSFKDISISFSKEKWSKLFAYSLMSIVGVIWPIINVVIRSILISEISIESAGIWEGMTKISGLITAIVGTAISTYFLPRFAEIINADELKKEVISGLKIILTATLIIIIFIYTFKSYIINILYTEEFVGMKELFSYQLIGDFFWVGKMTLSFVLVAKAMIKKYIILEVLFGTIYLGVSLFFVFNGYGLISVPLAHLIYNLLYFFTMLFVFINLLRFKRL